MSHGKSESLLLVLTLALYAGIASASGGYDVTLHQKAAPAAKPAPARPATSSAKATVNVVRNGGYESNGGAGTSTISNWAVVDQSGGSGSWFAQAGTASPMNGFTVNAPPEGSFAAMTDQSGRGSHVLYQDIAVPSSGGTLRFTLFIDNSAGTFATPATLDYTVDPNQQFRADIMDPAAGDFDVGAGVLANVYQTQVGDPATSGYTTVSFPMGAFAGQTVRLRFAEVDNQDFFNAGVDNVQLLQNIQVPVMERTGLVLLAALMAALGVLFLPAMRRG